MGTPYALAIRSMVALYDGLLSNKKGVPFVQEIEQKSWAPFLS
jgi:hypothetical protein